jgi:hypothetical protein
LKPPLCESFRTGVYIRRITTPVSKSTESHQSVDDNNQG